MTSFYARVENSKLPGYVDCRINPTIQSSGAPPLRDDPNLNCHPEMTIQTYLATTRTWRK